MKISCMSAQRPQRVGVYIAVIMLPATMSCTAVRKESAAPQPPSLTPHAQEVPPGLAPVAPQVISHGPRNEKKIALTFDACSTRRPGHYDERVTQVLMETHTPATIFLGGKWMEDEPEQTKFLASQPQFELGNHTFLHPHMTEMSDDRAREELQKTSDIMYRLTGRHPALFRPPYGEYNDHVVGIAAELGMTTVEFDLASGDPNALNGKKELIDRVCAKAHNGSIIVMHINRRGWHTAEALPEIIEKLRTRGFTFVTVGDLIRDLHGS